jgi:hypothetical protein
METFFAKQEGRPLPAFPIPARAVTTPPAPPVGLTPMASHAQGGR